MTLKCCICMFTRMDQDVREADTIMNGQAVCFDHTGYVRGSSSHSTALAHAIDEARRRGRLRESPP